MNVPGIVFHIALFFSILFASCRLSRTHVIGKWDDHGDTLVINNDDSFVFIKYISRRDSELHPIDTLKTILTGQWTLDKKSVHFEFTDTMQTFGGDCTTYQYWNRLSKKKLIRPRTCQKPTHELWVINKIE